MFLFFGVFGGADQNLQVLREMRAMVFACACLTFDSFCCFLRKVIAKREFASKKKSLANFEHAFKVVLGSFHVFSFFDFVAVLCSSCFSV